MLATEIYYRQSKNLRKGNVVTGLCHSVREGDPRVTITHDTLDFTGQEPAPPSRPPPQVPSGGGHGPHMAGKGAVRILLNCFLVHHC